MGRFRTVVVAALAAGPTALQAQRSSTISVAVTPYFGLAIPGRDLLLRPGLNVERDPESQALYGVVGGRLTIGLTNKFAIEGDIGFGKSGLKVSSLSAPSGTDAKVTMISGRLVYRMKPTTEPSWFAFHAGVASVRHSFTENSGVVSNLKDGSGVGGVFGATLGFRMTERTAFTITAEDYLYNASFDVAGTTGGAIQRSQSLTQNDLRVTLGVRVPLVGR